MGIITAIKTSCLSLNDEQKGYGLLYGNGIKINQDYNYFQQQKWYRLQEKLLFDPNKLIFLNIGYKDIQEQLINRWKIVDIKQFKNCQKIIFDTEPLQSKWKFAIRKGVPIIYYKNIIEMLFTKNFTLDCNISKYQTILYEKVKKSGNRVQVVTFCQQSQLAFINPFLNKEGIDAAKRITFVLSETHSQLEYNPYIIKIICLLLIFISEEDTYDIIGTMIDGSTSLSVTRQQSLRWHFSLTQNQLDKLTRQFFKTVKKISPSINLINDHLNTEGIQKYVIFKTIINEFFIGYLPFPVDYLTIQVILRIFLIYLNQGVKILYRIFYSILKICSQLIKDSSNTKQIIRVIKTKMLNILTLDRQITNFFKLAFDLRLDNFMNIKKCQKDSCKSRNQDNIVYYLPQVDGDSQILSYLDMETIWGYLPEVIKHYNVKKIFSSEVKPTSLSKMVNTMLAYNLTLIVVQSVDQTVFGVFIAQKLKSLTDLQSISNSKILSISQFRESLTNSQIPISKNKRQLSNRQQCPNNLTYFGSLETFVFTLRLSKHKYPSTGQNIFYITYNENILVVGGPQNQPALQIDSTLSQGVSYSCKTYNNQPLHGGAAGQFKIKMVQAFSIQ